MSKSVGLKFLSSALALSLSLTACSKKSNNDTPTVHPDRQAETKIEESFAVKEAKVQPVTVPTSTEEEWMRLKANQLVLKKSALKKAFLLSPTMVLASHQPIIDHMLPKVVSFERAGDQVALFELNANSVYDNMNSDRLLETFMITAEDDETVTFTWSYSLSALPMVGLMSGGASDFPAFTDNSATPILPVAKSFVRKAVLENNRLEIEQISEIRVPNIPLSAGALLNALLMGTGLNQEYRAMTVKLNVSLRPYVQNPNFQKRLSPFHKGIGPFEVDITRKGHGAADFHATLWDLHPSKGPLVYALTKGTPPEYVQAIKEGILYWNKVTGREIIQVETDADPEQTPTERKVLVHWIPWDQAGFARASMQSDPLTGEIIRADVYLTSAFATGSAMNMRKILENQDIASILKSYAVMPQSFQPSSLCHFERPWEHQAEIQELDRKDPAAVQKLVMDELRHVTAHEVGHTLGMRHNFAGSLDTEFSTYKESKDAEKEYVAGRLNQGARTSSSVMDYIFGISGGVVGAFIKEKPLTYDQKFMQWSYVSEFDPATASVPAFCSDGSADVISSCVRGDVGTNTMMFAQHTTEERSKYLVNQVLQMLVMSLHPKHEADKMTHVQIMAKLAATPVQSIADNMSSRLASVRSLLVENAQDYAIEMKLGKRSLYNESAYQKAMAHKIDTELKSVGGVWGLISSVQPMDASGLPERGWLKKKLLQVYNRPEFKKGTSWDGVDYALTAEEDAFIGQLIENYADSAEEAWLSAVLKHFAFKKSDSSSASMSLGIFSLLSGDSSSAPISEVAQQEVWWPQLAKLAQNLMTLRSGNVSGMVNDQTVELPKSAYQVALRKQMVELALAENYRLHSPEKAHLKEAKAQILLVFKNLLGKELTSTTEVKTHLATVKLDMAAKKWFDQEIEVLKAIEDKI